MDRAFLIQLTNAVYRLTLLFPKKEPLRYKMREVADDILARPNEKDLEVLDSFFEVALAQNWAKTADILAIKGEYDSLKEQLSAKKEGDESKDSSSPLANAQEITIFNHNNSEGDEGNPSFSPFTNVRERKEKILAFLQENGQAQVWQVKQLLPEVSKRTLRRDFEDMLEQGLIERLGERNDTFYKIKTIES
jgi:hypothetical protein